MSRPLLPWLLAALALHLLLFLILSRLGLAHAARLERSVEVELIHVPQPQHQPQPQPQPQHQPQPQSRPQPQPQPQKRPAPKSRPPKPDPRSRSRSRPPAPDPLSLGMRSPSLDLSLQRDPAPEAPTAPGETPALPGESESARMKKRVDGWLARTQARGRVESGRVHPYLYEVLRALDHNFQPTLAMIPKIKRRAGPAYLRAYKAAVSQYNSMGQALPFDPSIMGETVTPPKLLEGFNQIEQAVGETGGQQLTVELCLRVQPGEPPRLDSSRRCGVRALDRHARRALDTALRQLAAAAAAPSDLPPGRACYNFRVRFGRDLPRIGLSTAFDLLLGAATGRLPGAEWFNRRVSLELLYEPPPAAPVR